MKKWFSFFEIDWKHFPSWNLQKVGRTSKTDEECGRATPPSDRPICHYNQKNVGVNKVSIPIPQTAEENSLVLVSFLFLLPLPPPYVSSIHSAPSFDHPMLPSFRLPPRTEKPTCRAVRFSNQIATSAIQPDVQADFSVLQLRITRTR